APAIALKPSSLVKFLSSRRASSNALFPYMTTRTAGVLYPLSFLILFAATVEIRPLYTGAAINASSSEDTRNFLYESGGVKSIISWSKLVPFIIAVTVVFPVPVGE
ncbi:hypothetical protein KAS14_07005, partial [Candidatus Bathyarchaeota archaeon]|nr:hypothetical protein [Candidatus Bathyarchaeota archaeon]